MEKREYSVFYNVFKTSGEYVLPWECLELTNNLKFKLAECVFHH